MLHRAHLNLFQATFFGWSLDCHFYSVSIGNFYLFDFSSPFASPAA
jgi:hypothetical protein